MEPVWYHVFNSTKSVWMSDDDTYGPYRDAVKFQSLDDAKSAAEHHIKNGCKDNLVVMADYGMVEV